MDNKSADLTWFACRDCGRKMPFCGNDEDGNPVTALCGACWVKQLPEDPELTRDERACDRLVALIAEHSPELIVAPSTIRAAFTAWLAEYPLAAQPTAPAAA